MDWFKKRRIGDVIINAAARWGEREALIYKRQRWTYSMLAAEAEAVAKGLIAAGVKAGDHVGIWLVNRPEWVALQFAIPMVGAVTVGLNTRYRTDDIAYTVDQSDCSMLIAADRSGPIDFRSILDSVMPALPKVRTLVMLGEDRLPGARSWNELLEMGRRVPREELSRRSAAVDPDSPAVIIFTSGTTSHPKGAVHSHIGIRLNLERARILGHTKNDVHLSYLPLFHAYGYSEISLMAALTGGKQVLTETFDADEVLELTEMEGGTVWHGFDTHWGDLLRAYRARPRQLKLRVGAMAAGLEGANIIARQIQEVFCTTVSSYAMSETWPFIAISHPLDSLEQRTEASGYPMNDIEVKIIDPDSGSEKQVGEPGEILIRGYTCMQGYYKKPEETAKTLDQDGWIHSGDVGRLRPDGHLVYMGRYKDMLRIGGENVAPAEVESRLAAHPGIREVAVVGFPDQRLGEVPVAFVVLDPDVTVSGDALVQSLKGRIASFKVPRSVFFLDALPKTPSGKIMKQQLREKAVRLADDKKVIKPPFGD